MLMGLRNETNYAKRQNSKYVDGAEKWDKVNKNVSNPKNNLTQGGGRTILKGKVQGGSIYFDPKSKKRFLIYI